MSQRTAPSTRTGSFPVQPLRKGGSALWWTLTLAFVTTIVLGGCSTVTDPDVPPSVPDTVEGDGWNNTDIGVVSVAGESEGDDDELVVTASGTDVWNEGDGFHFTYQALAGDGSLTVRVDALDAAHEWSKAGVMIREDLTPGARNAFVLLTDFNGALFQRREVAGGSTADVLPDGTYMRAFEASSPWWLRIERQGDTLVGSHSPDGESWTELGTVSLALPDTAFIGMAVTSRDNEATATAAFSNVAMRQSDGSIVVEPQPDPTPSPEPEPDPTPEPAPLPAPEPIQPDGTTVSTTYQRSLVDFPNPERGFHGYGGSTGDYAREAGDGHTLVRRYVRLDDYRYSSIPSSVLDDLDRDLAALRDHGLKVILRFSYNFGFDADAPLDRVLQHIEQVAPLLQEHTDVIAVLQAGFIGAWGEWHNSTNDLTDFDARQAITSALLDAMDESRMIQIRYPYRARDLFPTPPSASSAFDGSDASRVGQVNDCFVSTGSDGGTFTSDADYTYMEDVTRYTVMGGETCQIAGLNDRNDGANAADQLERFHWDYLNEDFYTPIIDKWKTQGYYDEIRRRLGYRYVLRETVAEAATQAGDTLSLNIEMQNEGYGKLYNPRPIDLVLRPVGGGSSVTLRANDDARTVLPGPGETRVVSLTVRVPSTVPAGSYDVHLSLPDAADRLADDPRYAVRLANDGVWNASTGENALDVRIDVAD